MSSCSRRPEENPLITVQKLPAQLDHICLHFRPPTVLLLLPGAGFRKLLTEPLEFPPNTQKVLKDQKESAVVFFFRGRRRAGQLLCGKLDKPAPVFWSWDVKLKRTRRSIFPVLKMKNTSHLVTLTTTQVKDQPHNFILLKDGTDKAAEICVDSLVLQKLK